MHALIRALADRRNQRPCVAEGKHKDHQKQREYRPLPPALGETDRTCGNGKTESRNHKIGRPDLSVIIINDRQSRRDQENGREDGEHGMGGKGVVQGEETKDRKNRGRKYADHRGIAPVGRIEHDAFDRHRIAGHVKQIKPDRVHDVGRLKDRPAASVLDLDPDAVFFGVPASRVVINLHDPRFKGWLPGDPRAVHLDGPDAGLKPLELDVPV